MTYRALLLSFVSLLALSGCETAKGGMQDLSVMGDHLNPNDDPYAVSSSQSIDNVNMRLDTGEMAPLPPPTYGMGNSSVDIFNDGGVMQNSPPFDMMQGGMPPPYDVVQAGMPSYAGGMPAMGDSSVTVFPLDGVPPMMGAGQQTQNYQDSYAGNDYGQSGYSSYDTNGNQIFFENGSSRLGSGDLTKLSNVAEQAKFAPVNRITVAGYASRPTQAGSQTVEGHILNLKESMNRSFAVSKELMKKGVPAEKIKAVSWGATKPTGNDVQDRRVDIIMGEQ